MENKKGRPISVNVKQNNNYFTEYYHLQNKTIVCECGLPIKSMGLYHHKKTLKHKYLNESKILKEVNI